MPSTNTHTHTKTEQCIELPPSGMQIARRVGGLAVSTPLPLAHAPLPAPNFVAFRSTFIWQEEPHSLVHVNHFWQPAAQPEYTHPSRTHTRTHILAGTHTHSLSSHSHTHIALICSQFRLRIWLTTVVRSRRWCTLINIFSTRWF